MRKMCCVGFAAIALIAAHNARAARAAPAASLVGIWFGMGEPNDPDTFYIDSFHADGTFNSEYRRCEKGEVAHRQTQSGTWAVANGVLTMHSQTVDGLPIPDDHTYAIESASGKEFHARLRGPDPDYLFVEKRVPAFEFPPCYVGS